MSDHIPIVDQIRDAPDHAARMRLLLACPRLHLVRCDAILRQTLNVAGFLSAADYVLVERVAMEAVRGPSGEERQEIQIMRAQAITRMRAAARDGAMEVPE